MGLVGIDKDTQQDSERATESIMQNLVASFKDVSLFLSSSMTPPGNHFKQVSVIRYDSLL